MAFPRFHNGCPKLFARRQFIGSVSVSLDRVIISKKTDREWDLKPGLHMETEMADPEALGFSGANETHFGTRRTNVIGEAGLKIWGRRHLG